MLLTNNSYVRTRFLGGILGGFSPMGGVSASRYIANALAFTTQTTVPEGYPSIERALIPSVETSSLIGSRIQLELLLEGDLRGDGNMESSASFDVDLDVEGNVLTNGSVTLPLEIDATGDLRAQGNCSVVMDIVGKPSSYDIAQEIWQAQSSQFNTAGTMGKKLNDAGGAGNPWGAALADNNSPGTFGWFIQKLLTVAKFIGLK
jgi:hypothetical protein